MIAARMIAALYVETGGVYYGLPDVDPWDEERDARLYDGPWPVVAHPPCARWCMLAPLNEAMHGYKIGDDAGAFAAALAAVRRFGGVLGRTHGFYGRTRLVLASPAVCRRTSRPARAQRLTIAATSAQEAR